MAVAATHDRRLHDAPGIVEIADADPHATATATDAVDLGDGLVLYLARTDGHLCGAAGARQRVARSDRLPGLYEGGLKRWEGSMDLARFLHRRLRAVPAPGPARAPAPLAGRRVLELGCGHGVPGIVALRAGADRVDFADLNADVLRRATRPAVARNAPADAPARCRFLAGNWAALPVRSGPPPSQVMIVSMWWFRDLMMPIATALVMLLLLMLMLLLLLRSG